MTAGPKCHWNPDLGWLTPEHRADCKDDCAGCRPCPKTHCALKGRCPNHVDPSVGIITCPGCVGKTRAKLAKIEDRYAELGEEIEEDGALNSEAVNLFGPAADPFVWERRWRRGEVMDRTDPHHPYSVLGRWDMVIREDYQQPTELAVSVSRARAYLDSQLARIANDDEQDFELFDREISKCLAHLETALSDSRAPERGAPCPTCADVESAGDEKPPRLVKHWAKRVSEYAEGNEDKAWTGDYWQCPDVTAHRWTEAEYRLRVSGDYLKHAKALTTTQMHEAHGVKPGSLTGWATAGKVRKMGKDHTGRQLYSVDDALKMTAPNAQSA
jgi:hypothetical protein